MDDEVLQRLASAVVSARGDRSQRSFATMLGVAQSTVQSWENCRNVPNLENLEKLAEIRGELPEEFVAFLYGRSLSESPIELRIKGMSRRQVARVTAAVADWLNTE